MVKKYRRDRPHHPLFSRGLFQARPVAKRFLIAIERAGSVSRIRKKFRMQSFDFEADFKYNSFL